MEKELFQLSLAAQANPGAQVTYSSVHWVPQQKVAAKNTSVPDFEWDKGLTFHQRKDAQRHDQHGDHEIGDGQRHKEVVGHILQPALPGDGQADKDVPGRCSQDEDEGQ